MEKRPFGRPVDKSRDPVILRTTLLLLSEVGYDRLRMQDVADRARVSLGTIYRRWPTKAELIRAALQSAVPPIDEGRTTGLEGLRRHLRDLGSSSGSRKI